MRGIFHTHMTGKLSSGISMFAPQWCFNQHESKPMGPVTHEVQLQPAFLITSIVTSISSSTHSHILLGPRLSPSTVIRYDAPDWGSYLGSPVSSPFYRKLSEPFIFIICQSLFQVWGALKYTFKHATLPFNTSWLPIFLCSNLSLQPHPSHLCSLSPTGCVWGMAGLSGKEMLKLGKVKALGVRT